MGTKMAPAYANLSMGDLEPKLQALGHTHIMVWKRFIDDIFIIWKGTKVEFLEYMDRINQVISINMDTQLHFTYLYSAT